MTPAIRIYARRIEGIGEADLAADRALLDDMERARAGRFAFETGRVEYIAAHALVRLALAEQLGADPRDFRFVDGEYGKPSAWLGPEPASVSFNLSHTRGMVAVGIAPVGMELGVDVEDGSRQIDLSVAEHYFAPPELAWLLAQAETDRARAFMTLWTLKEAFIKAAGKGMSQELDRFWFADPSTDPIRIGFAPDLAEESANWGFEHRVMPGGYHLSVGWRGPGRVEWREMPDQSVV